MAELARETIDPDDPRLAVEGLVALCREGGWWAPWRLPPDRVATAHAPVLTSHARKPAGARIGMRTDATEISMAIERVECDEEAPEDPAHVDIVVDGHLAHRLPVAMGSGSVGTELPAGSKEVEIWLPHASCVRIGGITLGGHREVTPAPRSGPRWITYGSSITHCKAADGPSETWPALVARQHGWHLTCLGFGGQCHLDPVVARTIRDAEADLISMCLGINIYGGNTYNLRTLASNISGFIETVRDGHPDTPIVVITPIMAPEREQQPNLAGLTLVEIREQVVAAVETLQRLGDANLSIIDGLDIIGASDTGLLTDGLHPSADGYRLMAERLGPRLRGTLDAHWHAAARGR